MQIPSISVVTGTGATNAGSLAASIPTDREFLLSAMGENGVMSVSRWSGAEEPSGEAPRGR